MATFWKTGKSQGILEISVKVREFSKKEGNCLMKLKILIRAAFHATFPTFEKRIKNNTSPRNPLVVEIFPSPTEPHTKTLPASI